MPVGDLAPALIALEELLSRAGDFAFPGTPDIVLEVKTIARGSFVVELIAESKQALDEVVNIFSGKEVTASLNLITILTMVKGFFWFRKQSRASETQPATQSLPENQIRITAKDGTVFDVPLAALEFFDDRRSAKMAEKVVAPLGSDGITDLLLASQGSPDVTLTDADLPAFEQEEGLPDEESFENVVLLEIANISFDRPTGWKFYDGQMRFSARVTDQKFLDDVHRRRELFGKGDRIMCRLRVTQEIKANGKLSTRREIVEVLDHRPDNHDQLSLKI